MWRFPSYNTILRVWCVQRGKQRQDKLGGFQWVDGRLWVSNGRGGLPLGKIKALEWGLEGCHGQVSISVWVKAGSAFSAIWIVHLGDALREKWIVIVVTQVIRLLMRDTSLFLEAAPSSWESVICRVEDCTIYISTWFQVACIVHSLFYSLIQSTNILWNCLSVVSW